MAIQAILYDSFAAIQRLEKPMMIGSDQEGKIGKTGFSY
ncbi:hypothetical protein APS_1943 [Acetobacter pasteurianus subsp. pasteurianus LMG 1262 = NBRC 106471]|nr:hypothetical protein APS_1943 [Acetobacter pasteurianus subsp. pasteurianus LMG 1262 = NBRC 106471]CCT58354.1 hypothetical protein APA386B_234 [Acetobacter pasteurianus 386B]